MLKNVFADYVSEYVQLGGSNKLQLPSWTITVSSKSFGRNSLYALPVRSVSGGG